MASRSNGHILARASDIETLKLVARPDLLCLFNIGGRAEVTSRDLDLVALFLCLFRHHIRKFRVQWAKDSVLDTILDLNGLSRQYKVRSVSIGVDRARDRHRRMYIYVCMYIYLQQDLIIKVPKLDRTIEAK